MIQPPKEWIPFENAEEQLDWLKSHKLTPPTFEQPKKLYYEGVYCKELCECTVVGYVDDWTAVICIDDYFHCIHPDHLVEMQAGKSLSTKGSLLPEKCDFIAIDFETATNNMNSACEIGIAFVSNLEVVDQYQTLIRPPENKFDTYLSNIHRISPEDTEREHTFSEHWKELKTVFGPVPVVAHSAGFDMAVLRACLGKRKCENFLYVDTMKMIQNIVPGKHGLENCCDYFGIELKNHHNAGDDAVACAEIAIACIKLLKCTTLEGFCQRCGIDFLQFRDVSNPNASPKKTKAKRNNKSPSYYHNRVRISDIQPNVESIDKNNPLFGKNIVFTGDLSFDRAEAMQLAVNAGAILKSSVSRKTNYLITGTQDPSLVGSDGVSTKEFKARTLIESGLETLEIISEERFLALLGKGDVSKND